VHLDQIFNVVHPPEKKSKEGFPYYFDRIKLIKHSDGYWTLENKHNFEEYNMAHFNEIRPVTWVGGFRSSFAINLDQPYDFIDKEIVSKIHGTAENFKSINWSKYPNLESIKITTNESRIDFSIPENLNIAIIANSELKHVDLLTSADSINVLISNVAIRKHDYTYVHRAGFGIGTSKELKLISKQSQYCRNLHLDLYQYKGKIVFDAGLGELEALHILGDTINLNCDKFKLGSLDSLIIYGHSASYDFLDCPHDLSFLGVYYSNENDLPVLKQNYPTIEYQEYCFPESANVSLKNNESIKIDQIQLGRSVLAVDSAQNMIESRVTGIEYHFDINDSLTQLFVLEELASTNTFESFGMSVQYSSGHPLNTNCEVSNSNEPIFKDCTIMTTTGEVDAKSIQTRLIEYRGTLINIRTTEGNFFVEDIGFLNK
jgi:hypothetical protein